MEAGLSGNAPITAHGWLLKDKAPRALTVLTSLLPTTSTSSQSGAGLASRLNRLKDYSLPLAKSQARARAFDQSKVQKSRNFRLLLMVLAQMERRALSFTAVTGTPAYQHTARQQKRPGLPRPVPKDDQRFIHAVILWLLWLEPAFFPATSHLRESEAAEMCTTDGRNYEAHLTSEIFFLSSSSLFFSFFPQITPRLGEIDRFRVQVGFKVLQRRLVFFSSFFFRQSQLW